MEVLNGRKVVESLQVSSLEPGCHEFWFRPSTNATGQGWLLPVFVKKGQHPGRAIVITAGVHGDELNGVLTAQKLISELRDSEIKGSVMVVPEINQSGINASTRHFIPSDPDAPPVDLNRVFPGKEGGSSAEQYIYSIWHKLLMPNAEKAIDLHTQTKGAEYPLYIFADYRIPASVEMARWMAADAIMDDPGDPGILETVWNQNNIPSITVEVGTGKLMQLDLVERAVKGVLNILKSESILSEEPVKEGEEPFEGKKLTSIRAESGGYFIPQVTMGQQVTQGELLVIQHDSFGQECHRYLAPCDGFVLSKNLDPLREPGALLVRLLHD
ncbi:succinylglutamate desuccinylase/aspartoacylase family protein [Endozoicomonas arenosclerae]|uniref:succinylglutamate desuccinylase/aspartoacylase family protein n=1 Tax=Endozoicomonas arenosclerae TaxID=1633495 RepID=UPI000781286C|nr:succinylglutamate desuccinylase/aspartoacylase family protein [Endozoicomonas arenosclerae]